MSVAGVHSSGSESGVSGGRGIGMSTSAGEREVSTIKMTFYVHTDLALVSCKPQDILCGSWPWTMAMGRTRPTSTVHVHVHVTSEATPTQHQSSRPERASAWPASWALRDVSPRPLDSGLWLYTTLAQLLVVPYAHNSDHFNPSYG